MYIHGKRRELLCCCSLVEVSIGVTPCVIFHSLQGARGDPPADAPPAAGAAGANIADGGAAAGEDGGAAAAAAVPPPPQVDAAAVVNNRGGNGSWLHIFTQLTENGVGVPTGPGLTMDIAAFLMSFFCSLLPNWNPVRRPHYN